MTKRVLGALALGAALLAAVPAAAETRTSFSLNISAGSAYGHGFGYGPFGGYSRHDPFGRSLPAWERHARLGWMIDQAARHGDIGRLDARNLHRQLMQVEQIGRLYARSAPGLDRRRHAELHARLDRVEDRFRQDLRFNSGFRRDRFDRWGWNDPWGRRGW